MREFIILILFAAAILVPSNMEAQQGQAAEPIIEVRPVINDKGQNTDFRIYEAGATRPFRGSLRDYHANGKVKTEFRIQDGKPSSLNVYYDNGRLDEEAYYLKISYNAPIWGVRDPQKYNYPNGDTRALYSSSRDIVGRPFAKDHVYRDNFKQKFRTKEQIDSENLPPFFLASLEKRARDGHEGTQLFLGYMYATGDYIPKDNEKSSYWNSLAAEQGNITSQYALAIQYLLKDGAGNYINKDKGIYWLTKAAEAGMVDAQFRLATIYLNDKDWENSFIWYTKAADEGNVEAMNNLSFFYCNGHYVEKDMEKGFNLLKKAADMDNPASQFSVGTFYEFGTYVKQDKKKAIRYYKMAANKGLKQAKKKLAELGVYY